MRYSLAILGLVVASPMALAQDTSQATTTNTALLPATLDEKNRKHALAELEKAGKAKNLAPGLQVDTIQTRVVGGSQVTSKSKYPFFVEWEDAKCGASLVWGGT